MNHHHGLGMVCQIHRGEKHWDQVPLAADSELVVVDWSCHLAFEALDGGQTAVVASGYEVRNFHDDAYRGLVALVEALDLTPARIGSAASWYFFHARSEAERHSAAVI